MRYIGIDPGSTKSGVVVWMNGKVGLHTVMPNDELRQRLASVGQIAQPTKLAIEMFSVASTCGIEVFESCRWVGVFQTEWGDRHPHRLVVRKEIYHELLGGSIGKDSLVRQALIARIGPVGTKTVPGPLFGVVSHEWQALAVAVTCEALDAEAAKSGGLAGKVA